jgi:hypothetical protein
MSYSSGDNIDFFGYVEYYKYQWHCDRCGRLNNSEMAVDINVPENMWHKKKCRFCGHPFTMPKHLGEITDTDGRRTNLEHGGIA